MCRYLKSNFLSSPTTWQAQPGAAVAFQGLTAATVAAKLPTSGGDKRPIMLAVYPSSVTLRVFLLIKSFKETQYQLLEVVVVQFL